MLLLSTSEHIRVISLLVINIYVDVALGNGKCHIKYHQFPGHTSCLPSGKGKPVPVEKDKLVDLHNELSANVSPPAINMLKMCWDNEVAMIAQKWAETCPTSDGSPAHDSLRFIPGRYSAGQNMAAGYSKFSDAIKGWYDEVKDYKYGVAIDKQPKGFSAVGHYTALVWAGSYLLGCGAAECEGMNYYICNYAPAGNMGKFKGPYKTGTKRGGVCKTKDASGGLCDCGSLECNKGVLEPAKCQCNCTTNGGRSSPKYWTGDDCHLTCKAPSAKDLPHCGTTGWEKPKCKCSWARDACPFMCKVCPFADPTLYPANYTIPTGSSASTIKLPTPMMWLLMITFWVAFRG